MKEKLFRFALKIYRKMPFFPFEKTFIRIYHSLRDENKIVETKIEGINYQLDLGEVIDNKIFYGNWEPETTAMFKKIIKPGMVTLDVGANIGYYTLIMAKIMKGKGKIIAFEPTSGGFERLKSNVLRNNFKNIVLEKLALSDKNKNTKLRIRYSWKLKKQETPELESIKMVQLDDYIKENNIKKVDFMKIDVDGHEYKILKGAKKTLKKYKPILCIEIADYEGKEGGHTLKEIVSFLLSLDYIFYSEEGNRFNSMKEIISSIPKPPEAKNFFLK